jgi:molybdopterin converting factor subunit 1
MMLTVQLFARAKDLAGSDRVRLELSDGARVVDLRRQLAIAVPRLGELLERSAIAVDGEFARDNTALQTESEVALLPPVSGGTW